jgi:hypothetical protein
VLEILSAFAELDAVGEFAGLNASGCFVSSGVAGEFAGLDELSGIADIAGSGEYAGCNVLRCGRSAGDFTPLLVGRDGKMGERVIVLGRIELSPASCDEDGFLIPGCMLLVGISDFGGCDELDRVLSSASADASVTCFSDIDTST